ncbi:MAG: hypothetical protein ABIQ72_12815 [Usitatibacter sp.]
MPKRLSDITAPCDTAGIKSQDEGPAAISRLQISQHCLEARAVFVAAVLYRVNELPDDHERLRLRQFQKLAPLRGDRDV